MLARVLAVHVERVGVVEDLRVAIGCRQDGDDERPGGDVDVRDARVARRRARRQQHGRVETQRLLDGVEPGRLAAAQRRELLGVADDEPDGVAEQVDGRLETGGEDEPGHRLELLVAEADAVVLRLDERAEQAVTRLRSLGGEVGLEPRVELVERALGAAERRPVEPQVEARSGVPAETQHSLVLALGHPQDLGDDGDGQLLAVARDEVDVMPGARVGLEVVEQLGGDLLGAFAQGLDGARGEHAGDELAVARVRGAVRGQQGRRLERPDRRARRPRQRAADRARGVAGEAGAEVVARQHLVDGVVLACQRRELAAHDGSATADAREDRRELLRQQARRLGAQHPLRVALRRDAHQRPARDGVLQAPAHAGFGVLDQAAGDPSGEGGHGASNGCERVSRHTTDVGR